MAVGATGLGFVGIGRETTKGTAVAATHYLPSTSFDGDDSMDVLRDEGMRASMATLYGSTPGVKSASFSIEGDVFINAIGFPLVGMLGAEAVTGGPTYVHTISLLNSGTGQAPAYTIHDYNGLQSRKYAGATESSLSLRVAAQELFTYSSAWTTYPSATQSAPTPSYATDAPMAGWNSTVSINASPSTLIEELDLTLTRNVTPVHAVDGDQSPNLIWQGPISVSGRMMLIASDETEFTRYLAGTIVPIVITFTQGSYSVVTTMTSCVYTSAKIERGDDFSQVSVQFEAQANTTDAGASGGMSPVKIVLTNTTAGSVYAA